MIDTGADVNLIKLVAIRKPTDIDSTEIIQLKGISTEIQNTLGIFDINIFGESTVFHVVEDYFPINADGILGNEFLRTIPTAIDDNKEILFVRDKKVPFTESSSFVGTVPNSESSTSDSATNIPKSEPSDFLSSIHTIFA
ncbi:hypothetical protein M0802_015192 [Mischocyttarus mexicanus]|nr:hypothetical protein M0802_015192 [Mischocyttarus mexicanus]